jgi:hypothetical protein
MLNIKSLIKGLGSLLNLFGQIDKKDLNYIKSPTEALQQDWEKVGKDIRKAINTVEKEIK